MVLGRPLPELAAEAGSPGAAGDSAGTGAAFGGQGGAFAGAEGGASAAGSPDEDPIWIAERCTPTLDFENRDTTSKGTLFSAAVPEPGAVVTTAAHDACRTLYRAAEEVKGIDEVSLVVEDYAGVASASGTAMRLSTSYLQSASERGLDLAREIAGILHFTTSLIYQNGGDGSAPAWLVTGIADFVRLQANLIDRTQRAKGGSYDDSSQTTAFFLDYLTQRDPDIVYRLNQRLAPGEPTWSDDVFLELTGSDLGTLWNDYQATLP